MRKFLLGCVSALILGGMFAALVWADVPKKWGEWTAIGPSLSHDNQVYTMCFGEDRVYALRGDNRGALAVVGGGCK